MSSFLSIFLIFAIISLTIFGWWYNSPKQKGKRGEMRIHDILMQLPDEYHVMDDVMLKTTNGTTQIDHIVVSKYGIFAYACGVVFRKNIVPIGKMDNAKECIEISTCRVPG